MNLPLAEDTVRALKRRKTLGLGVHLNVTLGTPVNSPSKVRTLLKDGGQFRRPHDYFTKPPSEKEVALEYEAQVRLFLRRFGRPPDHLDTHHHLHDIPIFFKALSLVARKWKVPVRRSRIFQVSEHLSLTKDLRTTDFLFGNLEAQFIWRKEPLLAVAENLGEGTGEIGCHPGFCDSELRRLSSMREVREKELKLFSSRPLRNALSSLGIELIRFSEI